MPFCALMMSLIHKIGILAGHGGLLKEVIAACHLKDQDFFILAFHGQTDPQLMGTSPHTWLSLGQIGLALKTLRQEGVTHLVMAGRFHRPTFSQLKVDATGALWLARLGLHRFGDDGLLKKLVSQLEHEGFTLISPEAVLGKDIFPDPGFLGPTLMNSSYEKDADLGFRLLKDLSPYDCAQSVVIQEQRVLGIEGPEGTDCLIERCGNLADMSAHSRRPILVKALKKGQETRVDRPVVGPSTLKHLHRHHFSGLVIEAGTVLILNQPEFNILLGNLPLFCHIKNS